MEEIPKAGNGHVIVTADRIVDNEQSHLLCLPIGAFERRESLR